MSQGRQLPAGHKSRSEDDWHQVLVRLAAGESAAAVESWLAWERADKTDPEGYTRRTVDKAAKRLQGGIDRPVARR